MQRKFLTKSTTIYDKNPPESRHRRTIPQHNKAICDKATPNIILNGEKLKNKNHKIISIDAEKAFKKFNIHL